MGLALYNTLSRRKEPFVPLDPDNVRLYACGPTAYDDIHIGNARMMIVFDVLFRLLRRHYPRVVYVRNITDVDDKIIDRARESGEAIDDLTRRTTEAFHDVVRRLGCLKPTVEPKATEHIGEMIALIEVLIARGHAYAAEGHALFHVPSMAEYGRLSGQSREQQIAGARVEVAPYKRDPADFVLWKPSSGDQPGWDSPWGRGRPGWHIECSAMAEKHLGLPFDIHGGGLDLVFPHHENEIAQSCCARGVESMARYWVHNGFLNVNAEKMSKSLGNFLTAKEALELADGEVIRMVMLGTHYRAPLEFSDDTLAAAKAGLDRLYTALGEVTVPGQPDPEFVAALNDDRITSKALAVLYGLATAVNKASDPAERARLKAALAGSAALVGLLGHEPRAWLQAGADDADIDRLILDRNAARKSRDFARADAIRDDLLAKGIVLEDTPQGTTWRRA